MFQQQTLGYMQKYSKNDKPMNDEGICSKLMTPRVITSSSQPTPDWPLLVIMPSLLQNRPRLHFFCNLLRTRVLLWTWREMDEPPIHLSCYYIWMVVDSQSQQNVETPCLDFRLVFFARPLANPRFKIRALACLRFRPVTFSFPDRNSSCGRCHSTLECSRRLKLLLDLLCGNTLLR